MKHNGDCPTCRFHRTYQPGQLIGALCAHPDGELYRSEYDARHKAAKTRCYGWQPLALRARKRVA